MGLSAGIAHAGEEIRVTLFGQPCTMTGPYSRAVLQNIHEISPEKLPPDLSVEAMKRVRAQTSSLKGVDAQIETYRDHLRKRLSAKVAFEEALSEARKKEKPAQKLDLVLSNIREHIAPNAVEAFEKDMRALFEKSGANWNDTFLAALRERYESLIQPDTEEEFHKAIRAAKVQYVCVFDEGVSSDEDDDETNEGAAEASPSPAPAKSPVQAKPAAKKPAPAPKSRKR